MELGIVKRNSVNPEKPDSDRRPKWVKIILACLTAWIVWWGSFIAYGIPITSAHNHLMGLDRPLFGDVVIVDADYGTQDFSMVVVLSLSALFASVTAAFGVKFQHRLLGRCSLGMNYLVIVFFLTIAFLGPRILNYVGLVGASFGGYD